MRNENAEMRNRTRIRNSRLLNSDFWILASHFGLWAMHALGVRSNKGIFFFFEDSDKYDG